MVALDTVVVSESFTDNFTVGAGQTLRKQWTFKNTGIQFIPKGSALVKIDGDNLTRVMCLSMEKDAAAQSYFDVEVEFDTN